MLPPGVELTTEALFDEIRSGNVETVRILIKSGLSANRVYNGVTPLEHVLTLVDEPPSHAVPDPKTWVAILKILVQSPEPPRGLTFAAHAALNEKLTRRFAALLRAGVSVGGRDANGQSLAAHAMRMDLAADEDKPAKRDWVELLVVEAQLLPPQLAAWMLCWAGASGRRVVVEALLKKGVSVDAKLSEPPDEKLTAEDVAFWWPGGTALHFAITRWPAVVRILLGRAASLKSVDENGQTVLHIAAARNDEAAVRLLLKSGANPSRRDRNGKTPLLLASHKTRTLLVQHTAVIEPIDAAILIHDAAYHRDDGFLELLLDKGVDANLPYENRRSPLFSMAYWWGSASGWKRSASLRCVDLLVSSGADVLLRDQRGQTVLHQLAQNSESDVVEKILAAGADPNAADDDGKTPLMLASSPEIADLLLSRGAWLAAVDRFGYGAVDYAVMLSRESLTEWFGTRGLKPSAIATLIGAILARRQDEALTHIGAWTASAVDRFGAPLINLAAENCLPTVINALLNSGADINSKSLHGETPLGACLSLSWALDRFGITFKEWETSAKLLLRRGASVEAVKFPCKPRNLCRSSNLALVRSREQDPTHLRYSYRGSPYRKEHRHAEQRWQDCADARGRAWTFAAFEGSTEPRRQH